VYKYIHPQQEQIGTRHAGRSTKEMNAWMEKPTNLPNGPEARNKIYGVDAYNCCGKENEKIILKTKSPRCSVRR